MADCPRHSVKLGAHFFIKLCTLYLGLLFKEKRKRSDRSISGPLYWILKRWISFLHFHGRTLCVCMEAPRGEDQSCQCCGKIHQCSSWQDPGLLKPLSPINLPNDYVTSYHYGCKHWLCINSFSDTQYKTLWILFNIYISLTRLTIHTIQTKGLRTSLPHNHMCFLSTLFQILFLLCCYICCYNNCTLFWKDFTLNFTALLWGKWYQHSSVYHIITPAVYN